MSKEIRITSPSILLGIALGTSLAAQSPSLLRRLSYPAVLNCGYSAALVGDIDGDGRSEVAIGCYSASDSLPSAGKVQVISGATGSAIWQVTGGTQAGFFGWSVSGAGDVNGDGVPDIVVGAIREGGPVAFSGVAWVFSGNDGTVIWRLAGATGSSFFGTAVDGAGDVDADGYDDVIVGANNDDSATVLDCGSARVYSGRTGQLIHTWFGLSQSSYGASVSAAGDLDGDGYADVVIGAPGDSRGGVRAGYVEARSGRTGQVLHAFVGGGASFSLGGERGVSGAGDVDRDGFDDLVMGASGAPGGGNRRGEVYVRSGRTGALLFRVVGGADLDSCGAAVGGGDDVDADGHADVIVSCYGSDLGGMDAGRVLMISGADGSVLAEVVGTRASKRLGFDVDMGHVLGDGFAQVLLTTGTASDQVDLFGFGYSGTPARATRRGVGCRTSLATLPRALAGAKPYLGRSCELGVLGCPGGAGLVLNLGLAWDIPLDAFGATGCRKLATADGFSVPAAATASGFATSGSFTVPDDPSLLGVSLASQWLVLDAAANVAGVVVSDALDLTFGRVGG